MTVDDVVAPILAALTTPAVSIAISVEGQPIVPPPATRTALGGLDDQLSREYRRCFAETGVHRRRSTTQAIMVSFDAFWDLITLRLEDHRILQLQRLTGPVGTPAGSSARPAEVPVAWPHEWLVQVGILQGIRWDLPTDVLARWVMVTFDGLHTDFVHTGDTAGIRRILATFAYDLGQHAVKESRAPR